MSKRNVKNLYSLTAENEGQTFFDLTDKFSASVPHTDRFLCFSNEYEKERKFEKTEESQS